MLTGSYGAPLATVDFGDPESARATINDWVSGVTEDKIPAPGPFTLLDETSVQVDTMHYNEFLPSAAGDGWQAVELPYVGDEVSMVVVVPDDLEAFEAELTPERLDAMLGSLRNGGIHLSLPRFTFRYEAALEPALRALGLGTLFGGPDLSGMGIGDVAVRAVQHASFIEVDEEGTRAAAATGVAVWPLPTRMAPRWPSIGRSCSSSSTNPRAVCSSSAACWIPAAD